jgi:hypothetical protein
MRRIVAAIVSCFALGCASAPILPAIDAAPATGAEADAARDHRLLPSQPKAAWHVAPTQSGAALELRF